MLLTKIKSILFSKYFLIGLSVACIGTYVRLYPLLNFTSNDISEKATLLILNNVRLKIAQQVEMNYSQLPPKEKSLLAKKFFDDLIRKDGQQLRETIDNAALNIQKNSPDAPHHPYLLASDSFYYYELTENIVSTGKIGEKVKGSKYLNPLMLAPKGHWEPFTLHPYIGFYLYKIQQIFNPQVDLMYAISFTPLLISVLSLIPFLVLCRRLNCQPTIAFISSLFYTLAPIFVKRSTFGWYDNDPYSTLFPLCILAALFQGLSVLKTEKELSITQKKFHPKQGKNKTISISQLLVPAVATSLFIMLYALFWQGWVFIFAVIFGASLLIIMMNIFFRQKLYDTKRLIQFLLASCLGGFLCVSIIFGANEFFVLFAEGFKALKNFMAPQLSLWPDIYISVSELHKADLTYIVTNIGGPIFFCLALIGLLTPFFKLTSLTKEKRLYETIIISVFFLFSLFITFGAQRFVMLCLVPASLLFAIGAQYLFDKISLLIKNKLSAKKKALQAARISLICVFLLLGIVPYYRITHSIKSLLNLIYNDTWDTVLKEIKEKTPANSIINTWWPPGHFIKATANRAVTFDGATINFPQAYWMANVFLSDTEEEALGLLRMLNNSGNDAADFLHNQLKIPLSVSVQMLKEITSKSKEEARELLNKAFNDTQKTEHLLSLTHATPPPSYCLIYKEFVDANLQLGFFGKWNFRSIEKINANPRLMKKVPPKNSKEYVDFIWNLVGGPFKYSSPLTLINQKDNQLFFQNNITVDLNTMNCVIDSEKYGRGIPQNIFYLDGETVKEKVFPTAKLPYSVVFYNREKSYNVILLDDQLARSLLVRLYFFEGKGLKHFHPFSKKSDLTGRTKIYVYKIDWN